MSQEDDYDDLPNRRRRLPPWLPILFVLCALVLVVPFMLVVLFALAFGMSNM